MRLARTEGKTLPTVVTISKTDSNVEKRMKELVLGMTSYDSRDRPQMADVEMQVAEIQS